MIYYMGAGRDAALSKPIEELTIMDDFMFSAVMRREKLCKPLLEYILKVKIKKIVYIKPQDTVDAAAYDTKSIRLDVYVEDDKGTVYDIEVQTTNKGNLPRRSRFYQGMIDIRAIEKGADYKTLKKSYVIFICNYDPFGKNRYIYSFSNRCDEDPSIGFGDEAYKIVLNTKGSVGEIGDELKALIMYLDTGVAGSEYTKELEQEVTFVKSDKKWRQEYMLMSEAYMLQRDLGMHETVVRLARKHRKKYPVVSELADILDVTVPDCENIIAVLDSHPDWDDEKIAEEIDWAD